jgi:hypothetical protein
MRSVLLSLAAFAITTPAIASDQPSKTSREIAAVAETLNNPRTQRALEGTLSALMNAMLDIRVDGFAKAMEPLNNGKKLKLKGNSLREIAEREDKNFDKKMERGTKMLVGGLGALSSALAQMAPQLEEAIEKVDDELDRVGDALPRTK